jgi:hypothetical protein
MHPMRRQGIFWEWADCMLISQNRTVQTAEGLQLDVRIRTSRQGIVQVFIGVYLSTGEMIVEEYYPNHLDHDQGLALVWREERARQISALNPVL